MNVLIRDGDTVLGTHRLGVAVHRWIQNDLRHADETGTVDLPVFSARRAEVRRDGHCE